MSEQIALIVYLTAKEGHLHEMKERLFDVVHHMSAEPDFINTWVHELQGDPTTIVLYETWIGVGAADRLRSFDLALRQPAPLPKA